MNVKQEDLETLDTLTIEAMNTTFFIAVSGSRLDSWKEAILGWIFYVEKEWSRFLPDSELNEINKLSIGESIKASPPLVDVLLRAENYRRRTNGLFSPYLLQHMQFHGYTESFPFRSSHPAGGGLPPVFTNETGPFAINSLTGSVERIAGGKLDLGGIGKGYAVEGAARWLKKLGEATSGIVDGGGDITVWSDGHKEWNIGVAHPFRPDNEIAHFRIKNGSVATSNVVYRSWNQGHEKKHHLLNGQTGLLVDPNIIQATVITEHCVDAEVMAKVCFMEQGQALNHVLNSIHPVYSLLLVDRNGKIMMNER